MAKTKTASTATTKVPASSKTAPADSKMASTVAASTLDELFITGLKEMYWTENHLVKNLPKMVAAAGSSTLQTTFDKHLKVTQTQASRLESIFETLGEKVAAQKCDAMEGLAMDGEHVIENTVAGTEARDTGLIMAGLKVENFEITCYTGLIQLATTLGQSDIAAQLQQSLAEEQQADVLLTELSQKEGSKNDAQA